MAELNFAAIKAKVDQRAADMSKPPFDSPLRSKRYVYEGDTLREMRPGEWTNGEWYNVTSITDPADGHVFVNCRVRGKER